MQTPDSPAGRLTEIPMDALRAADVLKPDEPGHPTNNNRAWSAVHEALLRSQSRPSAKPVEVIPLVRDRGASNLDYLTRKGLIENQRVR